MLDKNVVRRYIHVSGFTLVLLCLNFLCMMSIRILLACFLNCIQYQTGITGFPINKPLSKASKWRTQGDERHFFLQELREIARMALECSLPVSSWGKGIESVYCWTDCYGRKWVHWTPGGVRFCPEVAPEPSWLTLSLRSWDRVQSPLPSRAGGRMNSRAYGLYLPSCLKRGRPPPWVFRALLEAARCSCVWPFNSQTLPEGEQHILIIVNSKLHARTGGLIPVGMKIESQHNPQMEGPHQCASQSSAKCLAQP